METTPVPATCGGDDSDVMQKEGILVALRPRCHLAVGALLGAPPPLDAEPLGRLSEASLAGE